MSLFAHTFQRTWSVWLLVLNLCGLTLSCLGFEKIFQECVKVLKEAHQQLHNMKNTTWEILLAAIKSIQNPPAWLKNISILTQAEISRLPKLDETKEGCLSMPIVEVKIITKDYLEFLQEQIRLNARGPEWTAILRDRLSALRPYKGKKVVTAILQTKPSRAALYINPETGQLFHSEID